MELIPAAALHVASSTVSQLGESPRWDAERGSLWWTDITGGMLHELCADGSTATTPLDRHAGAVNFNHDGTLLLATTAGLEVFDPEMRLSVVQVPVEADDPGRRMNDAAVDAHGRVFAGSMRWDAGDHPHDGVLYRIDLDGSVHVALTGLGCPNAIAWPDPTTMVFIDSLTRSIAVWAVDEESGSLIGQTGEIDLSRFDGIPDGMTLDAEGELWVAFWGGGAVRRIALEGSVLSTIDVPTPLVTSVAFGGPGLDSLFITTARASSDAEDSPAGLLYRCAPGQVGHLPNRRPATPCV